jgi:deoxyribose-phosphate aldolase
MYEFPLTGEINLQSVGENLERIKKKIPSLTQCRNELHNILSFLDLTSLDGTDHPEKIRLFCRKALAFKDHGLPLPAAVCVYPPFIGIARRELDGTGIRVATTAAAFPSGQLPIALKLNEIRFAVEEGADEIDVVISRGTFLEGNYQVILDELGAMREAAGTRTLKIILETGELGTFENIARASELAIRSGADFIKTSTGKSTPAATPEAVYVMMQVICHHHQKTGIRIGIKPAGGIADPESALMYYYIVKETAGESWLSPTLFRIGASRLANQITGILLK